MIPDLPGLVIARLQAQAKVLRQVGGAADLDAAASALKAKPASFVLPLADRPSAPPFAAEFRQRIVLAAGVLMAVSHKSDPRGDAARSEALVPVRQAVRDALARWQPEGCIDPMEFIGGRIVRLADGLLWWQDDFATSYLETV